MPELIPDSWRRILHVGLPSLTSSLVAPVTTAFITSQVARYGHERRRRLRHGRRASRGCR